VWKATAHRFPRRRGRIGPARCSSSPRASSTSLAEREVEMLLIEPRGVPNTGDQGGERTARTIWI
jgi:hypothetical protein